MTDPVRVVGWKDDDGCNWNEKSTANDLALILAHDEAGWLIDLVNKHGKVPGDVDWHDLAKKFIDELLYHAKELRELK